MRVSQVIVASAVVFLLLPLALAHVGKAHNKGDAVKKEQKAWGIAGDAGVVRRTVEVRMTDALRFIPDYISITRGETVKFIVKNDGKQMHEFVLGTKKELDGHAKLMMKSSKMEHDEPYVAHVSPGKTSEVIWTFNRSGEFNFGCLIPGHYPAMTGTIKVSN